VSESAWVFCVCVCLVCLCGRVCLCKLARVLVSLSNTVEATSLSVIKYVCRQQTAVLTVKKKLVLRDASSPNAYVRLFWCLYIRMYACMYVYVCIYSVCMYVRTYVFMYVRICVCVYICMYVFIYLRTYVRMQ
jgi:hypothetical protein